MDDMIQDMKFETILAALEDTVHKMEQGGLSLEESMILYEKGITLEKELRKRLDASKQMISQLSVRDGAVFEEPFGETDRD